MDNSRLWPFLAQTLRDAMLDPAELLEKAKTGEVQILEVEGAVAITALTSSGPFRHCNVIAVAGTLSTMPTLDAKVEEFARANGCSSIETAGRAGWTRVKPPAPGYKVVGVKYRKVLEEKP